MSSSSVKIGVWEFQLQAAQHQSRFMQNIDQTAQSRSQEETAKGPSEVMTNVKELSQELKTNKALKPPIKNPTVS